MREKPISTPPARGIAPPLSPVPAPRPVIEDAVLGGDLDDRRHFFGGARKHHQFRARLVDAAVVLVKRQIFGAVEITARARPVR